MATVFVRVEAEKIPERYLKKIEKVMGPQIGKNVVNGRIKIEEGNIRSIQLTEEHPRSDKKYDIRIFDGEGCLFVVPVERKELEELKRGKIPQEWLKQVEKTNSTCSKIILRKEEEIEMIEKSEEENVKHESLADTEIVEEVVTQEDVKGKEIENLEAVDTTDVTEAISGAESKDVETPEEKGTGAIASDMPEVTEEAEPKGIKASKIEDVVEEEIPDASEEKTESEGKDKVPKEENEKGGDKPKLIKEPKKMDDFSAIVAIDASGKQLAVKAISSYSKNQRYYLIYEKDADGTELGALNYAAKIEATKFEKRTNAVTDYIKNMSGNYNGQLGNIQLNLQKIEKDRMLKHSPVLDVEASTSFDEFYEKLKLFIERNVLIDTRIAVFEIKNTMHVAIIRTMEKSLMQVFKEICREVDDSVNPNIIKGLLYNRDLLHHDNNPKCRDCQLTISSAVREQIGSRGDKVISIKFDNEFIEKIKLAYSIGSIEYEEDDEEEEVM